MAVSQTGPIDTGFIDKRRSRDFQSPALAEIANMVSITALRTRLNAISATTFSTARLDSMTTNDMVYALRMHSADVAGVK